MATKTPTDCGSANERRRTPHNGRLTSSFTSLSTTLVCTLATPEIVACYATTGKADYLIKVVTSDIKAYDEVLQQRIFRLPGVASVHTSVVLREVKDEVSLPL